MKLAGAITLDSKFGGAVCSLFVSHQLGADALLSFCQKQPDRTTFPPAGLIAEGICLCPALKARALETRNERADNSADGRNGICRPPDWF